MSEPVSPQPDDGKRVLLLRWSAVVVARPAGVVLLDVPSAAAAGGVEGGGGGHMRLNSRSVARARGVHASPASSGGKYGKETRDDR